jgi:hypothetical protein
VFTNVAIFAKFYTKINTLTLRSPLFAEMFCEAEAKGQKAEFDLGDMSLQTAEILLDFVYNGEVVVPIEGT